MNREQLEHVIRAAGDVLGEDAVILVGSQAVLGQFPEGLPSDVTMSREVDVMALRDPNGTKALLINGAIGEMSRFDEMNAYYAEGVESELVQFPRAWRERVVPINTPATNGVTGYCAEIHDVCVAKLVAGRSKDLDYVRALVQSGHARPATLVERIADTDISAELQDRLLTILRGMARPGRRSSYRRAINARRHGRH